MKLFVVEEFMKKVLCVVMFALLFVGCDVSGLLPPGIFDDRNESIEYTLESGDSFEYFGVEVEVVTLTDRTVEAGPVIFTVDSDNSAELPFGKATVLLGKTCITITYPGTEPLVYSSL